MNFVRRNIVECVRMCGGILFVVLVYAWWRFAHHV